MQDQHVLLPGIILDRYKIIGVLGAGGFGITYLAEDTQLSMKVVIKEYFPNELAIRKNDSTIIAKTSSQEDFTKGMQRFKEEAKTLARFNHPSIVKILGYFEANNTAYFVMEYEEGIDLAQYIKEKRAPFNQEEILSILMPILEGLKEVHKHNYLHRDIKPGNILLRHNKSPVLIDFGASKLALGDVSKSITSMLTEGYAPLEQYSTDVKQQGPFTDLYAVGAVIYKMITGNVPPSAQTRSYQLLQDGHDPYKILSSMKLPGYNKTFLSAVDRALSIKARARQQNIQDFQKDIVGELKHTEDISSEKVETKKGKSYVALTIVSLLFVGALVGMYVLYQQKDIATLQSSVKNETTDTEQEKKKSVKKLEVEKAIARKKKKEAEHLAKIEAAKLKEEKALGLKKQKEAEQLALDTELKKLEEEKLQAKREKIYRLKKEKEEREHIKSKQSNLYVKIDTYRNGRFGFSLMYPSLILTKKTYPENGDGVWLSNEDGTVQVTPSAAFAFNTSNGKQMYKEALSWKKQDSNIEITYKRQKNNWYVLSGYDHSANTIFYEKYYLVNGVRSGFSIIFPTSEKKKYEKLVTIIAKNFVPSQGEQ